MVGVGVFSIVFDFDIKGSYYGNGYVDVELRDGFVFN